MMSLNENNVVSIVKKFVARSNLDISSFADLYLLPSEEVKIIDKYREEVYFLYYKKYNHRLSSTISNRAAQLYFNISNLKSAIKALEILVSHKETEIKNNCYFFGLKRSVNLASYLNSGLITKNTNVKLCSEIVEIKLVIEAIQHEVGLLDRRFQNYFKSNECTISVYNGYECLTNDDDFSNEIVNDLADDEGLYFCARCKSWKQDLLPCIHHFSRRFIPSKRFITRYRNLQELRSTRNNRLRVEPVIAYRQPHLIRRLRDVIWIYSLFRTPAIIRFNVFSLNCWPVAMLNVKPCEFLYGWFRNWVNNRPSEKLTDECQMEMEPILPFNNVERNYRSLDGSYKCIAPQDELVVVDEDERKVKYTKLLWKDRIINQMEEPHGDCDEVGVEQKENVILTTHALSSSARPVTVKADNWEKLCSPQQITEYTNLMSRWQRFSTVEWKNSDAQNTLIHSWDLPVDFILDNLESPSAVLFKNYAYFRSDLEVKIVLNSNKFHCGQLQASFYYGSSLDEKTAVRENVWCASQMTHCILDAGSANDGILVIPYRFYKPLMGTFARKDDVDVLNMGKLRLFVLNQLKLPTNDTNRVKVTLFMRFVNPSFHGMKPRVIGKIQNEMFSVAGLKEVVNTTANLVNQVFPDPQRDNPLDPIPAKSMVPWSAHSWCIGDVLPEPSNPLRLQGSGSTPHPPGTLPEEPEQSISYINSVFGLIKTVKWSKDDVEGKILYQLPFSPHLGIDYPVVKVEGKDCYVLPPVSLMSQLFAYWRGSIEYRLDLIATQFHTGRIAIGFIPRLADDGELKNIGIRELSYCDHVVIDLRDAKQFNYVNGYLSDKPWWPRRSQSAKSAESYAPGQIFVMVLNQLTATSTVSPDIEFNVYMRAGKDFELHIPVSPSIGLSFNTKFYSKTGNKVSYIPAYGPPQTSIYVGNWHTTKGLVFRYGPVSDHITQFNIKNFSGTKVDFKTIYKLATGQTISHPQYSNLAYLALFTVGGDESFVYGAPFDSKDTCSKFITTWNANKNNFSNILKSDLEGEYLDAKEVYIWEAVSSLEEFEVIYSEMNEERVAVCGETVEVQKNVNSTWNGLLTFGEQITNIKQLTRRYQPYGRFVNLKGSPSDPARADFGFPVMPQGLNFVPFTVDAQGNYIEDPYANQIRDGVIPILASGYRFYRGSIRYRLIAMGQSVGCMWLQHRPDYKLKTMSVFRPNEAYNESLYQTNYASYIQTTSVNEVLEFEVPFYLSGQFGLLQQPNLSKIEDAVHYSMGNIYCGFDSMKKDSKNVPYYVQIFYSMGDDMSFSVFQGFPPIFFLNSFDEPNKIENQMFNGIKSFLGDKVKEAVKEEFHDALDSVDVKQVGSDELNDQLKDKIVGLLGNCGTEKKMLIFSVVSNLIHSFINPTISTVAWSIASVLMQMGLIVFNVFIIFKEALEKLLGVFGRLVSRAKKSKDSPHAEADFNFSNELEDDKIQSAFVSTCVTSMLALAGCSDKPLPKSLPNFASYLYSGLPKFSLTANYLFTFLQNNIMMFKRIWYWMVSWLFPEKTLINELHGAHEDVVEFVREVQYLIDARNEQSVRSELVLTTKVYSCANIAQLYLAKKAQSKVAKNLHLFEKYCTQIIKLRDELTREMLSPPVRFEPFVICIEGETNVGKSFLAQVLFRQLFESIGYKTYNELVYTRTPGNAYWNGLVNQPGCLFDDFLCIEDTNFGLTQIGELFCLKSKAVFNPPMAACEEKKLRYNPLIVILCCNKAFPVVNGVGTPEAWYRRRDIMFRVSKKDQFKDYNVRAIPAKDRKDFNHLEFSQFCDPGNSRSALKKKISYGEFLSQLMVEFKKYFEAECHQYDNAIRQITRLYPDCNASVRDNNEALMEHLEAFNNSRISSEEKQMIENYKFKLQQGLHKSDFSFFVRDRIMKEKLPKSQPVVSQMGNSEDDGADFSLVKLVEEKTKKRLNQEMLLSDFLIKVHGGGLKANLDISEACNCNYDRTAIKTEVLRYMNKYEVKCECALLYPFIDTFISDTNDKCAIAVLKYPSRNRFDPPDTIKWLVDSCGDKCDLDKAKEIFHRLLNGTHNDNLSPVLINLMNDNAYAATVDAVISQVKVDDGFFASLWAKIPSFWKVFEILSKCLALIGVLSGISHFVSAFIPQSLANKLPAVGWKKEGLKSKSWSDDFVAIDQMTKYSEKVVASNSKGAIPKSKPLAQANAEQESVIKNKVTRNTFWLRIEYSVDGKERHNMVRCLGLKKNAFIIIDHYLYLILYSTNVRVWYCKDTAKLELPLEIFSKCRRMEYSAICVGFFPCCIPNFVNLVKFFVPSRVTTNLSPRAYLLETDEMGNVVKSVFPFIERRNNIEVENDVGPSSVVGGLFMYERSGRGICGSVLVSDSNMSSPILGIHIAGYQNRGIGFSEALIRESFDWLDETLTDVTPLEDEKVVNDMRPYDQSVMYIDGNVEQVGALPRSECVYPPKESRLIHTECYNEITKSTYDLPVLDSKDKRLSEPFSPLMEGCKYHALPITIMPDNFVKEAFEDLQNLILAKVKPKRQNIGKLGYQEAICGISSIEGYVALEMQTSESYPWIKRRPAGCSDKSWMFTRTLTNEGWRLDGMDKELEDCLERNDNARRTGYYVSTMFVDTLKDAKLPKEKVLIPGKTRIFSMSPVDYTIAVRQYFMDFVVAYQYHRFEVEHAIGIDIHSIEAHLLVVDLLNNSDKIIAIDYSKFGDRLYANCVYYVFEILIKWYEQNGDENSNSKLARRCLGAEVRNAYHIMLNNVYRCFGGMPSGNPLTVIINSMVNSMYIRVAWMGCVSLEYRTMLSFKRNVCLFTYGDDVILSVKDNVIEQFNGQTIIANLGKYGIKMTGSVKDGEVAKFNNINHENITFLKCHFVRHEFRNLWIARMDKRSVEEICNWTWKTQKDVRASSQEACLAMLELCYGHGKRYYTEMRQRIIDYWIKKGVSLTPPSWDYVDQRIFGD